MNLFFLSVFPEECAKFHCDKHIVKMILETAQILYTTHHQLQKGEDWINTTPKKPYKQTHVNHPVTLWARQCPANYLFTSMLGLSLCKEYTFRYRRIHASQIHMEWLGANMPPFEDSLQFVPMTPPAPACPEECKIQDDPIKTYRNYYRTHKEDLLQYTLRTPPEFLSDIALHKEPSGVILRREPILV